MAACSYSKLPMVDREHLEILGIKQENVLHVCAWSCEGCICYACFESSSDSVWWTKSSALSFKIAVPGDYTSIPRDWVNYQHSLWGFQITSSHFHFQGKKLWHRKQISRAHCWDLSAADLSLEPILTWIWLY